LRRAATVVEELEADVTTRGLIALLTDADGVIVRTRGGSAFSGEVARTRLVEGACWDEGSRGTNAIGTAIAERRAVAVVGRAHFESTNHGLFCYAAPIFDPYGELACVLDVTGPTGLDHHSLGAAVARAASEIEEALRSEAYATSGAGTRRLIETMIERTATPALLIEPSNETGVVRRFNESAALELELEGRVTVEHVFGIGWPELVREAASGKAVFETKRHRFDVTFESIVGLDSRTLGIVCFFDRAAQRPKRRRAPSSVAAPPWFDGIVATDPNIIESKRTAAKLAVTQLPILLLAETGTGKELFARAIHAASDRAKGPLVTINCGALSSSLLESELFGYAPGAFTGANRTGAEGKLAAAHRGTLFLDEIAEMSTSTQAVLLRFLEDGSYSRVGEAHERRADVRVVAATCRDLPARVAEGTFRSDLFYRIQGGCVRIPPLRDRSDRLDLARALVRAAASKRGIANPPILSAPAEAWILDHSWPGNVRELKTAVEHALAVSTTSELRFEDFPEPLMTAAPNVALEGQRDRVLREMAAAAVERAHGNVSEAARVLGVARSTVYRMLGRRGRAD
jgi:transcriptional regulator of acetoin/glycerol metabolism